jgi:hypothetical protein
MWRGRRQMRCGSNGNSGFPKMRDDGNAANLG